MKLLVTGAWGHTHAQIYEISQMGHELSFMPDERGDIPCRYEDVEAVVCNALFQYHPIERFKNLKYIQLTSAGFDRVPMDYVREHEIEIHNARGVYSIPMAEFAVGAVLQLYKQSTFFYNNKKSHHWEKHRGLLELAGKTVCIVGCGDIGTECAIRFQAFGCTVFGINRTVRQIPYFDRIYGLDELKYGVENADIVVLSVALCAQTRHMIDAQVLTNLKDGAVLVNLSRGEIVDTQALISVLAQGKIYAILDVFEDEPLCSSSPLWDMENVILTPHNSFVGEGNARRLARTIIKNLEQTQ